MSAKKSKGSVDRESSREEAAFRIGNYETIFRGWLDGRARSFTLTKLCEAVGANSNSLGDSNEVLAAVRKLVIEGRVSESRTGKGADEDKLFAFLADEPAAVADIEADEVEADDEEDAGEPNDAEAPLVAEPAAFHATRYLRHTLTEAEREELRTEREEEDARIEQLTADLDSLKKQAKHVSNEIEILASKGLEKSKTIRLGWRMQDVPCEERRELDTREDSPTAGKLVMVTYRLDTQEPIDWRPLTYQERQGVLFDEAPASTPAGVEVRGNGTSNGSNGAASGHLLDEAAQ